MTPVLTPGNGSVRNVLGVPVNALRMEEVVALAHRAIDKRCRLLVGVVNAAKIVNMHRDAVLRDAVMAADVILADGMAVVWASQVLADRVPERVTGIDLMYRLLEEASARNYAVFCLGGTEEVNAVAAEEILRRYPGLRLAGRRNGFFNEAEEPAVAQTIRASHADILLAGMSSPKKERFLTRWAGELGTPVCHGVGGAFDILAGKTKRAPGAWQRAGMEWLFRLLQEPRRMWRRYLVTNTLFAYRLFLESCKERKRRTLLRNQCSR